MSKKFELKPISAAIGAALTASVIALPTANADENPFTLTDLSSGFMVAGDAEGSCGEGKCGEGKCGENKDGEGACGEGKCGEAAEKGAEEGSCGEGKCGEGKCGEEKSK